MRRKIEFAIGEYYHIFNRGVEKKNIFTRENDYIRFLDSMIFFNTEKPSWVINDLRQAGVDTQPKPEEKLVDIISYCLNPNHFHFLLKEKKKNGITTFMKKICTGYAMYFNKKYDHSGALFQGRFKSSHIKSNDKLLYISAYINCNCEIHGFANSEVYPWSSFKEYTEIENKGITDNSAVLDQFKNGEEYRRYSLNQISEFKQNKEMEE